MDDCHSIVCVKHVHMLSYILNMPLKNYAYNIFCATAKSSVLVCRLLRVALGGGLSIKILSFASLTTNKCCSLHLSWINKHINAAN